MWKTGFFLAFVLYASTALALDGVPARDLAAEGHALAVTWCASCHVVDPDVSGTDAAPTFASIAAEPGVTSDGLKGYLLRPHGEMPNYRLSFPHLDAIIAYILSLRPEE